MTTTAQEHREIARVADNLRGTCTKDLRPALSAIAEVHEARASELEKEEPKINATAIDSGEVYGESQFPESAVNIYF